MVKSNLCLCCSEVLHENCGLCHNENCDLYTEEKYCEDCGEELCYSCDSLCHNCTSKESENLEDSELENQAEDYFQSVPLITLTDNWISEATEGIKAVRPVAAMFAVPNKKVHDAKKTIGVLVIRLYKTPVHPPNYPPAYRVISFIFEWEKIQSMEFASPKWLVLPAGFRISGLFGLGFNDYLGITCLENLLLYVKKELENCLYPPELEDGQWVIRTLLDTDEAFGQFVFDSLNTKNVPILNGAITVIEKLSDYGLIIPTWVIK